MTDDAADELADRLEAAERMLDTVTEVVDDIRDPESSEGVHPHPDIADRVERLETRIDTLSTLVLEVTRETVSEVEAGTDDPGDEDAPDADSEDSGNGGTSRGYY